MKYKLTENQFNHLLENLFNEMAYPTSFSMSDFKKLPNFAQRIKYCDERLQKISSGSSRIVYKVDDEKVLKIAKNKKGIAQNEVESEYYKQNYSVCAKVFETDLNDTFVEMELANKVTPSIFKKVVGVDIKYLKPYMKNIFGRYKTEIPSEIEEQMNENEWIQELQSFIGDYDMGVDDVTRLSSFGLVKRDGQDDIVLIDFGLTMGVFNDYYARH